MTCPSCGSTAPKDLRQGCALWALALAPLGLPIAVAMGVDLWVPLLLLPVSYVVALLLAPRRWRCRNCRHEWGPERPPE
jgi:hypothetical protein